MRSKSSTASTLVVSKPLFMDYNKQKLEAVEQKIEALLDDHKLLELKKKKKKRQLDEDGEAELEQLLEKVAELKDSAKRWFELVKITTKKDAKMEEETITFGDATAEQIQAVTGVKFPIQDLDEFPSYEDVVPSDDFMAQYFKNRQVWCINSEASQRTYIDLFLRDVVARLEFQQRLKIFCELSMGVSNEQGSKKIKLSGRCDYTIGHTRPTALDFGSHPNDIHLLTVEAKEAWINKDCLQCIAEMATVYKSRKDAGKENCTVWGIWTNAYSWQFFLIDNDGQVYRTVMYVLQKDDDIKKIYRFVYHCVKQAYNASPTESCAPTPVIV